jgi:hypothetical protein
MKGKWMVDVKKKVEDSCMSQHSERTRITRPAILIKLW